MFTFQEYFLLISDSSINITISEIGHSKVILPFKLRLETHF